MADFNVYIFHPYGGKKTGFKEAQFSPLADSERKDSLSINVEFVKFHLTRSRKMNFEPVTSSNYKKSGEQSRAVIRFSTIVDIGSASFKYDMRRLTEILAFPKAWYRRRIVRRLFLGDLSVPQTTTGECDNTTKIDEQRNSSGAAADKAIMISQREKLRLSLDNGIAKHPKLREKSISLDSNASPSDTNQITAWETLVLFAFNFTKLNVQMNMGNVMGNVVSNLFKVEIDGIDPLIPILPEILFVVAVMSISIRFGHCSSYLNHYHTLTQFNSSTHSHPYDDPSRYFTQRNPFLEPKNPSS